MIALSIVAGAWGFAAFVFSVAALGAVGRVVARRRDEAARARHDDGRAWPRIAILRPCEGRDDGLEENLFSSVTAAYAGEREVLILIPRRDDPSWADAERACARARERATGVAFRLIETAIDTAGNRKVAQLAVGERHSDAPVIMVVDSDVRLDDRTLPSLVGALERDPRAGMSSAAYREEEGETLGDRVSSALLSSTPHAFVCLSALQEQAGGAHVTGGGLLALRRAVLDELGGFASLEQFLGEDFELARRMHARGYTVPLAVEPARFTDRGRGLGWVLRRYARWATVTRQQRPLLFPTYVGLLGCSPILLALLALIVALRAPFAPVAAGLAALALAVRVALSRRLRGIYEMNTALVPTVKAMLLGESLIVAAALLAVGRREVEWRGRRYRVERGGILVGVTSSPPRAPPSDSI